MNEKDKAALKEIQERLIEIESMMKLLVWAAKEKMKDTKMIQKQEAER